ncbi:LysR family transcriptional regulator [Shimazuella kribbensis]|uniref:LysR family transcriptional regulator n=1 Tax=Shimazuella kribbensis TaxID=139808 RepID=UPI00041976AA|nr:LysR family transcriptional regulator [Shimazuella kribbensis]
MELLQLQYFQKVARLGHLTKAAEELHIAQPALSKTIARLENDLGVALFDRQKRQIRLNEYGQTFLKQVDIALAALEEGKKQVMDQADIDRGRVTLASTDHQCDAELVSSFLTLFPNNRLLIKQTHSEEQNQNLLQNREIDFYITSLPVTNKNMENHVFVTEEIYVAVPKTHPFANYSKIDLHALSDEDFISLPSRNHFRHITDGLCKEVNFQPQTVCEVEELSALSSFVAKGIGVAFITEAVSRPEITLIPIKQQNFQRSFQLVWLKEKYLSKSALRFQEYLIHYYQNEKHLTAN